MKYDTIISNQIKTIKLEQDVQLTLQEITANEQSAICDHDRARKQLISIRDRPQEGVFDSPPS